MASPQAAARDGASAMRIGMKLALVGLMLVLLLVPLGLLDGLVAERQQRGLEVADEIARSSAGPQALVGPLLLLEIETPGPLRRIVSRNGQLQAEAASTPVLSRRLLAPGQLAMDNRLRSERRGRSVFSVPLFHDAMAITGRFQLPPEAAGGRRVRGWLVLGLGDSRGLRSLRLAVGGRDQAVEPGPLVAWLGDGVHAELPAGLLAATQLDVALELELTGTGALAWQPLGGETTVTARGDWPHPGYQGRHLPLTLRLDGAGFEARWAVSRLAGRAAQVLAGCPWDAVRCEGLAEGQFGLRLVDPVDRYLMTDRAMKYALLFLGLVFGAVLLVEILAGAPVHPLQYGLTGLGLAMFYLLLLSLSEHIGFGPAYALAALACSGLLAFYLAGVLGGRRRGLAFGLGLGVLYGLLYALLSSEDYALLVGAVVLFAALATVMALTRRLDWSRVGSAAG